MNNEVTSKYDIKPLDFDNLKIYFIFFHHCPNIVLLKNLTEIDFF